MGVTHMPGSISVESSPGGSPSMATPKELRNLSVIDHAHILLAEHDHNDVMLSGHPDIV